MTVLKLGTRGSPLALVQANMVKDALFAAHGIACEIHVVKTTGDRVQDRALAEIGGKALWTKELDRALLEGEIDFAISRPVVPALRCASTMRRTPATVDWSLRRTPPPPFT